MRRIAAVRVGLSVCVCLFVCLLVTSRSPAKPIDTCCVSADIQMSLSLVAYRYTIAPTRATNRGGVISHWRCSTKISLYISETVQDRDIVTLER